MAHGPFFLKRISYADIDSSILLDSGECPAPRSVVSGDVLKRSLKSFVPFSIFMCVTGRPRMNGRSAQQFDTGFRPSSFELHHETTKDFFLHRQVGDAIG